VIHFTGQRGRRSEVDPQITQITWIRKRGTGDQRSEVRRSEVRGRKTEGTPVEYPKGTLFNWAGKTEDGGQKTEDGIIGRLGG